MRISEIITEWRESYLYHATSIPNAVRIWRSDSLRGTSGPGPAYKPSALKGVSTTRNYNYALGYLTGTSFDDTGGVIFWINQDLVKRDLGRRRLIGYDWFYDTQPDEVSDEFQFRSEKHDTDRFETVITKGGLTPLRKYVSKIEIWLPKTFDYDPNFRGPQVTSTDDPDRGKINIRPDEKVMAGYLSDPMDKKAWDAMLRDPRVDVKQRPGMPQKYQGKRITPKVQFDTRHPMYRGSDE